MILLAEIGFLEIKPMDMNDTFNSYSFGSVLSSLHSEKRISITEILSEFPLQLNVILKS